jgi:hypothetical protein
MSDERAPRLEPGLLTIEHVTIQRMDHVRGPEGIIVELAEQIG